jgi:hypothetical protein
MLARPPDCLGGGGLHEKLPNGGIVAVTYGNKSAMVFVIVLLPRPLGLPSTP